ncbi:hypothetical protein DVK85_10040 [Flavobacterium arcticum]|uniref:Uncharacterized protein n=1 Tax=Flavobacterium arcticum TaxID=1784713 RepID=A0A345HD95_9FLAO|nr:hypothetical protein DVK85_10040 [Flavobacterium arcticum]
MKKTRIKWWVHILLIFIFILVSLYYYYKVFFSGIPSESYDLMTHRFITVIVALIIIHFLWLLFVLIRLLYNRQFINAVLVLMFVILNAILIKVVGFLWALTMGM